MNTKINALIESYEENRKKFAKEMEVELKALFKEYFEANPTVALIKWTQYTPYFNDGDECIFSVHDLYFALEGEDFSERAHNMHGDGDYTEVNGKYVKSTIPEEENFQDFRDNIRKIPNEIFKDIFGDHCQVMATRNCFQVEEYEHD